VVKEPDHRHAETRRLMEDLKISRGDAECAEGQVLV
jgi:hypothetical protein